MKTELCLPTEDIERIRHDIQCIVTQVESKLKSCETTLLNSYKGPSPLNNHPITPNVRPRPDASPHINAR